MRYIVFCHRSDLTFRHLSQSVCVCACVWSLLAACVILEAALLSRSYLTIAPPLPPHSLRYKSINNLITAMHLRPSRRRRAIIRNLLTDGGCAEDTSDTIFSWRELTVFSLSGRLSSSFLLYILTHSPSFYCSSIGLAAAACAARP